MQNGFVIFAETFPVRPHNLPSLQFLLANVEDFWRTTRLRGDDVIGFFMDELAPVVGFHGRNYADLTDVELNTIINGIENALAVGFDIDHLEVVLERSRNEMRLRQAAHQVAQMNLQNSDHHLQLAVNEAQEHHQQLQPQFGNLGAVDVVYREIE